MASCVGFPALALSGWLCGDSVALVASLQQALPAGLLSTYNLVIVPDSAVAFSSSTVNLALGVQTKD